MRISFVLPNPTLNGGMRVVALYAKRLQERGHDVEILFSSNRRVGLGTKIRCLLRGRGWPSSQPTGVTFFQNIGIPQQSVPPDSPADAYPDADVAVATWWRTAEIVEALPAEKGAKAYFLQHYEVHPALPIERVKNTWRLPLHKIVVHQWLADIAANEYGDHDVSVVPNSVDTELFNSPARGKQPVPTVGMMYSDAGFKGCDIAIEAVRLAREKRPNLRLVAFGATSPMQKMNLPADAEFTRNPPQTQIRDIYAKCDAWLFSSRTEGFGLPVLEAMACHTPVIGTPVGVAPDMLGDGCGILVKPEDPKDMAEAILRVADMAEAEWKAMSEAGYAKVRSYTWDDATDLFEQALQTAIQRQPIPIT